MKKGFTLIELLAVIVILAIIAVIAVPIVLNIINDSKESATLRSADFYLDGVEKSIATSILKGISIQDDVYSIMQDGNICIGEFKDNTCDGDILKVEMDGEVPTEGTIKIKNGEVSKIDITISNKEVWIDPFTNKLEYKLAPGLYDENDKLLMSWDELVTNYDFENLVKEGYNDENAKYKWAGDMIKNEFSNATKLVIKEGVKTIGFAAFDSCTNLKEVIIPNGVVSIKENAFGGCTNLSNISIPESVTSIGNSAFSGTSITTITISNKLTEYSFEGCQKLETVIIEEGVSSIPNLAFFGCTKLTNITIPDSVESIGANAFEGCKSLKKIKIPNRFASIGHFAFSECNSLTTIYYKGTVAEGKWGAPNATVVNNF